MSKNKKDQLKPFKVALAFFGVISLAILGYITYAFLSLFVFDIEARDFDLYDQFKAKVTLVEQYHDQNGVYPSTLSDITDVTICSKKYIDFCKTIKYKTVDDQGFRMAAKSLSWPIFYYSSKYPETIKTANWAKASGEPTEEGYSPVYKKTPPIFENPEEWPKL
jgi:hypothetical protein